ncbi:hypothetical protein QWZ08_07015 [Ferruginibacter paludis]|uniref:hypothetical protein n=1 Tax=Ferruginibacter paludis TaxID=1310417 RepID=UPI0025B506E2|nr:hypothetical protein [Ferruginibacter paludis]MDN3655367.1 hypothetical protein [Ferruginibacter paludis]
MSNSTERSPPCCKSSLRDVAGKTFNTIVGNGKRLMACKMIDRLEANNEIALLQKLSAHVEPIKRANNKQHDIAATNLYGRN